MRTWKVVLIATAVSLASTGSSFAAGSGGGGAGGMPSQTGPRYDAASEYARAVAALKSGDYKVAARAAEHVTEVAPKSVEAWRIVGAARAGALDWKGSRRAYERAVKVASDDIMSHAGLGIALANLKDDKARGELDWLKSRQATCAGTCPEAANLKSLTDAVEHALGGGGEVKPSAALSGPLLFAGANVGDAAYVQAVSLINEKRYEAALKALAEAEAAFGPHPDILTYQGYTWRKIGDLGRAEAYYRQALALAPGHRGATEYYGELKVERGDLAGARVMLARLDRMCAFGCAEAEELRRWVSLGHAPPS